VVRRCSCARSVLRLCSSSTMSLFDCHSTATEHFVLWRGVLQNCTRSDSMVPRELMCLDVVVLSFLQTSRHTTEHESSTCLSRLRRQ
jgi:hypothetical protein